MNVYLWGHKKNLTARAVITVALSFVVAGAHELHIATFPTALEIL